MDKQYNFTLFGLGIDCGFDVTLNAFSINITETEDGAVGVVVLKHDCGAEHMATVYDNGDEYNILEKALDAIKGELTGGWRKMDLSSAETEQGMFVGGGECAYFIDYDQLELFMDWVNE